MRNHTSFAAIEKHLFTLAVGTMTIFLKLYCDDDILWVLFVSHY